MKLRLLPLLLVVVTLLASACDAFPTFFIVVRPISAAGCTIHVTVSARAATFYSDAPVFSEYLGDSDGMYMPRLFDATVDDAIFIDTNDVVQFEGTFNMRRIAYFRGIWFVEILADVERTIYHMPSLFGGQETDTKNIMDNGWVWVHTSFVDDFEYPFVECVNTGERVDLQDQEVIEPFYMCIVDVTSPETPGHVGPGDNRSVRGFVTPNSEGYGVSGRAEDSTGRTWYELDVPDLGFVWVLASLTDNSGFSEIDDPYTDDVETYGNDCFLTVIPEKEPPPLASQLDPDISGSPECESFRLISPLDSIPTGATNFNWTEVADADHYLVTFYNYYGEFAAQYTSDTNSLALNTGEIPTGSEASWEVYAMFGDEILCRTVRSSTLSRRAQEIIITETEEPTPKPKKKKSKSSGGYTPPTG